MERFTLKVVVIIDIYFNILSTVIVDLYFTFNHIGNKGTEMTINPARIF